MFGFVVMTVAGFTFLATGAAFATCPNGLSAYWKLDNNYDDFIGDNDGSGNDAPTAVAGTVNGAQEFNGGTTGIDVPASGTFNWLTTDSFSIEYWIKMGPNTSGRNMITLGRTDGTSIGAYWFTGVTPAGMPTFQLQDSSGSVTVTGTTAVTDNAWHLVVAVRDAITGKNLIYVDDGAPVEAPAAYTGNGFLFNEAPLYLGWFDLTGVGEYRLAGSLDEVALYDRALTANEIAQHYTAGLAGNDYCGGSAAPTPGDAPFPNDTISLWPLDEAAGSTTYVDIFGDNDGSGNDAPTAVAGTVNGAQEFNGGTTGIDVPASGTFNWLTTDSFSIEYWIKMGPNTSGRNMITLGRTDGTSIGAYWFTGVTPAGMPTFQLQDSSGSVTVTGTTAVTDNAWHLVVAVRDAITGKNLIYVDDGAPVEAPAAYTGNGFLFNEAPLYLGWFDLTGVGEYRLAGSLDEVALYDRALTANEIAQHYTAGLAGNGVTSLRPEPVANAGANQSVTEAATVTLAGTGTPGYPGQSISTYAWVQTAGTQVVLTGASSATATFTAPDVGASGETLTFRLTVTADDGLSSSNATNVTVSDIPTVTPPPVSGDGGGGGGCFISNLF